VAQQGVKFIGLDLAWSAKNPSGVAVLEGDRNGARLVSSGLLGSDAELLAFFDVQLEGPVIIAIDAPLSVPNLTGQRPGERELATVFARFQAAAHPANRTLLGRYNGGVLRGEFVKQALEDRGVTDDPHHLAGADTRVMAEVYPHAAMVALFGLSRTLKYKAKRQGRAALDAAWTEYRMHLAALAQAEPPLSGLDALLAVDPSTLRGAALKNHEDETDAVLCAYVALYAHTLPERTEVFGTVQAGYILTPTLPERWR
jgi:predicted RNase H-like nuclease